MNAQFAPLFAFVLTLSASVASAQGAQLYAPRGGNTLQDNGPRIVQEAQQFKGYGTRTNNNEDNTDYADRTNGTYRLKATVLIFSQYRGNSAKRVLSASGRTKQEAMSDLRDQVDAIGANARVIQITFLQ